MKEFLLGPEWGWAHPHHTGRHKPVTSKITQEVAPATSWGAYSYQALQSVSDSFFNTANISSVLKELPVKSTLRNSLRRSSHISERFAMLLSGLVNIGWPVCLVCLMKVQGFYTGMCTVLYCVAQVLQIMEKGCLFNPPFLQSTC